MAYYSKNVQVEKIYTQAEQKVYEELKKIYPVNSIVSNVPLRDKSNYYADFLIIDEKTKIPVMVIEVKYTTTRKQDAERRAFESLKRLMATSNYPLKVIGAIAVAGTEKIEYVDFTEALANSDYELREENYFLPSYGVLTTGTEQKEINHEKVKQKKRIDVLKWICWAIIPVICVLFFVVDYFEFYEITTVRLILLGALGVVVLIPCFQEIKIGEISLKRKIEKSKEKSK